MNDKPTPTLSMPMDIETIKRIIPHRYPFLMVDRITEFVDAERIVGQKNVSALDPWFTGHFPGRPIMPGVLMLEALAQLGVIFARLSTGGCAYDALMVFTGAEKVRFRRIVVPGDVLTLELLMAKRKLAYWKMTGRILVGDEVAMEAEISAAETKQ